MFKTVALIFAVASVAVAAQDSNQKHEAHGIANWGRFPTYPGIYIPKELTSNRVQYLHHVISNAQYKAYTGNSICVKHIDSLEQNRFYYKYSVNGCELPKDIFIGDCKNEIKCDRSQFEVVVAQASAKITSITRIQ